MFYQINTNQIIKWIFINSHSSKKESNNEGLIEIKK